MNFTLFIIYILLGSAGVALGRQMFLKLNILDKPGKDVPKRKSVPTLQGLVIIALFFGLLWVTKFTLDFSFGRESLGLFVGGGIIAGASFIDELGYLVDRRFSLSPWMRFGIQIIVAIGAWWFSGVGIDILDIVGVGSFVLTPLLSLAVTVAWFLFLQCCTKKAHRLSGVIFFCSRRLWTCHKNDFTSNKGKIKLADI